MARRVLGKRKWRVYIDVDSRYVPSEQTYAPYPGIPGDTDDPVRELLSISFRNRSREGTKKVGSPVRKDCGGSHCDHPLKPGLTCSLSYRHKVGCWIIEGGMRRTVWAPSPSVPPTRCHLACRLVSLTAPEQARGVLVQTRPVLLHESNSSKPLLRHFHYLDSRQYSHATDSYESPTKTRLPAEVLCPRSGARQCTTNLAARQITILRLTSLDRWSYGVVSPSHPTYLRRNTSKGETTPREIVQSISQKKAPQKCTPSSSSPSSHPSSSSSSHPPRPPNL